MKTCTQCHVEKPLDAFYTKRADCKECVKARSARTRQRIGKEVIAEYNKKVWEANKDELKRRNAEYYQANKEHLKERMREYYANNKSAFLAYNSKRRATLKNATPSWADMDELKYIAQLAQERGLEIDHIVPLNHPEVCGLHVPDNIRCIPHELNAWKSNKLLEGVRNGL